jgi:hypothetical protein
VRVEAQESTQVAVVGEDFHDVRLPLLLLLDKVDDFMWVRVAYVPFVAINLGGDLQGQPLEVVHPFEPLQRHNMGELGCTPSCTHSAL